MVISATLISGRYGSFTSRQKCTTNPKTCSVSKPTTARSCPANQVYKGHDPACQPTCARPDPENTCLFPETEVCACDDPTHVVNDTGFCVPAQTCGCQEESRQVRQAGNSILYRVLYIVAF